MSNFPRLLFVLKQNQTSGGSYDEYGTSKSGLLNSAKFVKNALKAFLNIESNIAIVVDGNGIDKVVHDYNPNVVIIEAIWCPPYKLKELLKIYPTKKWIIRIHSKTPFLANEGIALLWLRQYSDLAALNKNLFIGFNAKETYKEFEKIGYNNTVYLPNFYFPDPHEFANPIDHPCFHDKNGVNIGCFSAIRPMKNQLIQAIAAIEYADEINATLYFHINGTRVEQNGTQVLKNIRALFENSKHQLIEWGWLDHGTFLNLISKMNVSLQVSLSESFNIVAGDSVYKNIPTVVSKEIEWMPFFCKADTGSADSIAKKIKFVLNHKFICKTFSILSLDSFNLKSLYAWSKFLGIF